MHSIPDENKFIGRNGSRKEPVEKLVNFLKDPHKQGFIQVFGCWEIGKTTVIEKAISEIREQKEPKIKKIKCFLPHPLTIETFKEAVEKLTNKKIKKFRPIEHRFKDGYNIAVIVKHANSFIDEECQRYEVALIWYQSTEIDYSYIDPSNLFLQPHVSSHEKKATRKVITEQRINTDLEWRNEKPSIEDEILIKCFDESEAYEKDEVRAFISQKIHKKINRDSTLFNNIVHAIRKFSGQHPGILNCICKYLNDAAKFSEQSIESCLDSIKELLPARKKSIFGKIEKLLMSLSNEAVKKIRCKEPHSELEYNGLLTKDESGEQSLILLLETFCKNYKSQKDKNKGGNMPIIEQIISSATGAFAKFLMGKLIEALSDTKKRRETKILQKIQEELGKFIEREYYTIEDKEKLAEIYTTLNDFFEEVGVTMISENDLERFKTGKKGKVFKIDEDLAGEIYQSNAKLKGRINKGNHDVLLFYKSTANKRVVLAPGKANFDNNDNPTKWEFDVVGLDDQGIYTFRAIMVDSESSGKILGMFPHPEYSNTRIKTFSQLNQFLDKEGVCFEFSNEVNFTRQ